MIKNKINSKTVIIVIVTLILMGLIIFFVGRSYGFFQYVKKGETTNVVSIKGIKINVIEDDNALNLENAEPLYDKDSMELKAFKFSMTNTSSRPIEYTIRVANDTEKQQACLINEGEENEEACPVLTTDNIRFSYKLNDSNWSEPINLGGTNNDTITTYTINGGETLTYSVKIWIKSDATNEIMNHYFFGQLLIQGSQADSNRIDYVTVTYNANGGSLTETEATIVKGTSIASMPEPTKDEYRFGGWYLEENFETKVTSETLINDSVTLYAKWLSPYTVTNLITNGSFENELNGWNCVGPTTPICSADTTNKYAGNYSAKISSSSNDWYSEISTTDIALVADHKYYTSEYVYILNEPHISEFDIAGPSKEYVNIKIGSPLQMNSWNRISALMEYDTLNSFNSYRPGFVFNGDIYMDNTFLIDLTETFGTGNEPDKEWCDANIDYFDGTTTVYK